MANQPGPRAVQQLAFVLLIDDLRRARQMEVEVRGHANRQTKIEPFARLFPFARREGIDRHEDVRLANLDTLPAVDQRISSGRLGEMHRDRVQLRAFSIVPGRYGANYCTV